MFYNGPYITLGPRPKFFPSDCFSMFIKKSDLLQELSIFTWICHQIHAHPILNKDMDPHIVVKNGDFLLEFSIFTWICYQTHTHHLLNKDMNQCIVVKNGDLLQEL